MAFNSDGDAISRWLHGSRAVLAGSLVFFALCVCSVFFGRAESFPYFAADEGLANVIYDLANFGKYGTSSIPLLEAIDVRQTSGYFTYGPWYFYLGAGLAKVFGFSVTLLRFIHPLGLFVACVLAWVAWRKASAAAAGFFTLFILSLFLKIHWPQIRMDIMCSVLATAGLVMTQMAMARGGWIYWFAAAFCVAAAAGQHPIAAPLAPALVATWGLHFWGVRSTTADKSECSGWKSLLALAGGALAAFALYSWLIDFRVGDVVDTILSAKLMYVIRSGGSGQENGYLNQLLNHVRYVFPEGIMSLPVAAVAALACGGAGCLVFARLRPDLQILALIAPPTLFLGMHLCALGLYPNVFAGYAILDHVLIFWAAGAVLAAFMLALRKRWAWGRLVEMAACLALAGWSVHSGYAAVTRPDAQTMASRAMTSFSELYDQVLSFIPKGATVWGNSLFGLEAPERAQLVQFHQGVFLASRNQPDEVRRLAPQFLLLGEYEKRALMDSLLFHDSVFLSRLEPFATWRARYSAFNDLVNMFPMGGFAQAGLVFGVPYKCTYLYRRANGEGEAPAVRANSGGRKGWSSQLGQPVEVRFQPSSSFVISARRATDQTATRNLPAYVGELPPGFYRIGVRFDGSLRKEAATVVVSDQSQIVSLPADYDAAFELLPVFPWEDSVYTLVRHSGGPLYVAVLSNEEAAFSVQEVRPVVPLLPQDGKRVESPLPEFGQWQVCAADGTGEAPTDGEDILIRGDASRFGYQYCSPRIPVSPNAELEVTLPVESLEGSVAVGILDSREQWLVPADFLKRTMRFNAGDNLFISVVVANCWSGQEEPVRSVFRVGRGVLWQYLTGAEPGYTERLLGDFAP